MRPRHDLSWLAAIRDWRPLRILFSACLLERGFEIDPQAFDFEDHPWYREYFGA